MVGVITEDLMPRKLGNTQGGVSQEDKKRHIGQETELSIKQLKPIITLLKRWRRTQPQPINGSKGVRLNA